MLGGAEPLGAARSRAHPQLQLLPVGEAQIAPQTFWAEPAASSTKNSGRKTRVLAAVLGSWAPSCFPSPPKFAGCGGDGAPG